MKNAILMSLIFATAAFVGALVAYVFLDVATSPRPGPCPRPMFPPHDDRLLPIGPPPK